MHCMEISAELSPTSSVCLQKNTSNLHVPFEMMSILEYSANPVCNTIGPNVTS